MGFATTNDGHEIYYEVHGTTGPTLVLPNWAPNTAASPATPAATDDIPSAYSVPRHALDLDAVLKALNLNNERVVLVTHSMGGNIATAYYLANPQSSVAGIVYTATYFDGKVIEHFLTYDALTAGVESPRKCVEFYTSMGLDESTALEAAKWPAYARRHNAKALLAFEIGDRYSTIDVPALIIHGEEDMASPVEGCVKQIQSG